MNLFRSCSQLKNITHLHLGRGKSVTDELLANLSTAPGLKELTFFDANITDELCNRLLAKSRIRFGDSFRTL